MPIASRISPRVAVEIGVALVEGLFDDAFEMRQIGLRHEMLRYNVLLSLWPLSWLEIARTLCQGFERVNRACATGRRS